MDFNETSLKLSTLLDKINGKKVKIKNNSEKIRDCMCPNHPNPRNSKVQKNQLG